jgi:hypothetical protein
MTIILVIYFTHPLGLYSVVRFSFTVNSNDFNESIVVVFMHAAFLPLWLTLSLYLQVLEYFPVVNSEDPLWFSFVWAGEAVVFTVLGILVSFACSAMLCAGVLCCLYYLVSKLVSVFCLF